MKNKKWSFIEYLILSYIPLIFVIQYPAQCQTYSEHLGIIAKFSSFSSLPEVITLIQ